jgi:signal peptidase I
MTLQEWLIFFAIVQLIHGLGTWKLYVIAGRKPWEAFVPIYNALALMKIINRPWWWIFLLFIPIIQLIMFPVVWVETLKSFCKNKPIDTILGVVTLGFYIYYVNYTQNVAHIVNRPLTPKKGWPEFVKSILFAIVVATTVHTYFIQPYTIPTSSLEKSLLVGDFLFVSKFHYGARTPMTTVALPMVHDSIPLTGLKSYLSVPQLPYFRFPAIEKIENNDIVVFNWPTDTVYFFRDPSGRSVQKPIDKKSNYVKRCLGIPGDQLEIKNGDVIVNGKMLPMHDRQRIQFRHVVMLKDGANPALLENYECNEIMYVYEIEKQLWDAKEVQDFIEKDNNSLAIELERDTTNFVKIGGFIEGSKMSRLKIKQLPNAYFTNMPDDQVAALKNNPYVASVKRHVKKENTTTEIFPHTTNWTADNLGPIFIPKAGTTIDINKENIAFYERIIKEYEGNKLEIVGNDIKINDVVANKYTFEQDYYWMMGDNRHNSEDSRYWGFVPHDHIVGKPVFIWMSLDYSAKGLFNKFRFERFFTTVGGNGKPTSYFIYFLIAIGIYQGYRYFRKKKAAENE